MAVALSLVVRITASRQDEVGLSPAIQVTSLVDLLDQTQADTIDVLPQPVLLKINRDLLMRPRDRLAVLSVNQDPYHTRLQAVNNKQELVLLWLEHHQCNHLRL